MSTSESTLNSMVNQSLEYVLDANVFMEAARRYYAFDLAMPFWDALTGFARQGILCSIDKVLNEAIQGKDALKTWAESDFNKYFLSVKQERILNSYAEIVQWAQSQAQYTQRAKDIFMKEENADTWVLAFAAANHITVVTHESLSLDAQKRIPIPNVCNAFNIKYCDTFKMLRRLKFSF